MIIRRSLIALLALGALTGCGAASPTASVQSSHDQTIVINTPGVEGATCILQNGARTWTMSAPGPVTVPRTPHVIDVNCFKGEHLRGVGRVMASFAPAESDTGEACISCRYPGIVTVALLLNDSLMAVPVLRQGP